MQPNKVPEKKAGPAEKFRAGGITATVWANEQSKDGKAYTFYTVSIERNYMDKDKQWQRTSSMRLNDLPAVVLVANKAYEFLKMQRETEED